MIFLSIIGLWTVHNSHRYFFWTQKNLIPGKGRGCARVTTLILFITNHIQSHGYALSSTALMPRFTTAGCRYNVRLTVSLTHGHSLPLQRHFSGEIFGYNSSIGLHQNANSLRDEIITY